MRLTTFSKVLITLLIVGGAYLAFRYFSPGTGASADAPALTENQASETSSSDVQQETAPSSSAFNFTPPAPVNARLKGVVELGASGFNSFIIKVDNEKNWSLEKAEFGASLVYENMATDTDVREGLKKYIAQMLDFGVGGKDIHFVVSSSAAKTDQVKKIGAGLKSLGYVVNPVTAEKEGQLALKAVLPDAYKDRAFVVDIGSGNTKISWMEGNKIVSHETYGSKFFQDGVSDDQVSNEVGEISKRIPEAKRGTCFIIGGAPYSLAKEHRNGKERYTVLKAPGDYKTEEKKTQSGILIYKAIKDATGCETFVFDWDSNFTIGFLLSL